jgi:hypothetical protein
VCAIPGEDGEHQGYEHRETGGYPESVEGGHVVIEEQIRRSKLERSA